MKKAMIALAAVVMAVVAQAASVSWSTPYTEYLNEDAVTGSYWLVALTSSSVDGIQVSDAGELLMDASVGTVVGSKTAFGDPESVMGSIDNLHASDNGKYYALVIVDDANAMYGVSGAQAIAGVLDDPPTDGAEIVFYNGMDSLGEAMFANTETVAAIPEPTSGLLMLLGMAGLALRRRRA